MSKSIFNLIEKATDSVQSPRLEAFASANGFTIGESETAVSRKEAQRRMTEAEDYLYALFAGENRKGERCNVPTLDINEMMSSSDVQVLLPRVISQVMIEPKEPNLFLTNNVVEEIALDEKSPLFITFPSVGALQAFEIGEGQEYKSQSLSFQEHMTQIRLKKVGLQVSLSEEIINHSIYPLLRLNMRLMVNAINRKVESTAFTALTQRAREVFNNNEGVAAARTSGKDASQNWNGSLALKDILTLAGTVVGARYEPSHMLIHPLAYLVIFQDPIIRAAFYHQGQLGGSVWQQAPNFDQSANMPFGITYVPYYALPYNETGTFTAADASGFASSLVTDVYVIDSRNSLYMATRGDVQMDQMDDWFKDATAMKARRYVGLSVKDGGKGISVARNVRVVENAAPLFTIKTVS